MRARAALLLLMIATEAAPQAADARRTIVHDGARRSYVVRVPRPAKEPGDTRRLPLVLVLHGGGGNAANAEEMTGFTEKGRREGFIAVYPQGSSRFRQVLLTWNAGHCCGYAMERRVDDVGFIDALLDTLIATNPVDPQRIYVTGMSNGAMMSHRLGIELPHRFAAIAPVVGTLFGDERPPRTPVSALMINGMLDRAVPWQGGPPGGRASNEWDGTPAKPALAQATFWAAANGCAATPETLEEGQVVVHRFRCPAGPGVELHLLKDNGHAWPGGKAGSRRGDAPSISMDATDLIWAFFKAHPRTAAPGSSAPSPRVPPRARR